MAGAAERLAVTALAEARSLVAVALGQALDDVAGDGRVGTVPGWDSLGHVRVILAVEGCLRRPLHADEVAAIRGIADIARLLGAAG
jgi:hypothetical protein